MKKITARPLTPDAFAPFGDVLEAPAEFGRVYRSARLVNLRQDARPSLSIARVKPLEGLPLEAVQMERHEFSSQTFVPIDVSRYLVIVAPKSAGGGPDTSRAEAFLAGPHQGVIYAHDTWHHPLSVLDRAAQFALSMWLDGTESDEEFVQLSEPFRVVVEA